MNKKSSLHFRIYTRLPFDNTMQAEQLCKKFLEFGDDFVPTKFSAHEPIQGDFDPHDISQPATLLSETSHHLLLKKNKPQWQAYIYWLRKRQRPWFWTFDFGKEWTKGDRPKQIADFLESLCTDFQPVFAVGGLSADWFDKHDVMNPKTGEFKESAGAGFSPGTGLPGIFWFNFFGKELVEFFGRDKLLEINDEATFYPISDCICFLPYKTPDHQNPSWRRTCEEKVIEMLGKEYFFDLLNAAKKKPRRRKSIPYVTDAKSFRD
jgi:hypothetical protein